MKNVLLVARPAYVQKALNQGVIEWRRTGPSTSIQVPQPGELRGGDMNSKKIDETNKSGSRHDEILDGQNGSVEKISSQKGRPGQSTGLVRQTSGGRSRSINPGNAGTFLGPTRATLQRRGGRCFGAAPGGISPGRKYWGNPSSGPVA